MCCALRKIMYTKKKITLRLEKILCAPKSNLCLEKLSPNKVVVHRRLAIFKGSWKQFLHYTSCVSKQVQRSHCWRLGSLERPRPTQGYQPCSTAWNTWTQRTSSKTGMWPHARYRGRPWLSCLFRGIRPRPDEESTRRTRPHRLERKVRCWGGEGTDETSTSWSTVFPRWCSFSWSRGSEMKCQTFHLYVTSKWFK